MAPPNDIANIHAAVALGTAVDTAPAPSLTAGGDLTATPFADGAFVIESPVRQTVPAVFASPHSGRHYPAEFIAASRLDATALRRSEDAFIDQLFAAVPAHGAPLLSARFPRAYVDANRDPFELDPDMFEDRLPDYADIASPRVAAGLGTVARVVASGADIYRAKLRVAEALDRIEACYKPYHAALAGLVEDTHRKFGVCLLVDCHSMPSVGGPMDRDPGGRRVDMVLGDRHGAACAPEIIKLTERTLSGLGYKVLRNAPYAGGYTTRHYGRPSVGIHAMQIEINRALYMDEARICRSDGFSALAADLAVLIRVLTRIDVGDVAALRVGP
jgi:N-formylglutamate amidohydrolase